MTAPRCVGDPPTCCQPDPLTPAQLRAREERIASAIGAKRDRTPSRCPRCGSEEICPMFDDDMLLSLCTDCGRPFCEAD